MGSWKNTKVKCHSYHILSRLCTINLIYHWWCWPRFSELTFIRFVCCKITLLFLIPHCIIWKEVTRHSPFSKDGELCSIPPWKQSIYVNFSEFCTRQCLFSPIYLLNNFCQNGLTYLKSVLLSINKILWKWLFSGGI